MNTLKQLLTDQGFPPQCYMLHRWLVQAVERQYINSTTIQSEAAAGTVYTYPDEDWRTKPILIIHISQGHAPEGDSIYSMELLR
jgi:hypothetical protein